MLGKFFFLIFMGIGTLLFLPSGLNIVNSYFLDFWISIFFNWNITREFGNKDE